MPPDIRSFFSRRGVQVSSQVQATEEVPVSILFYVPILTACSGLWRVSNQCQPLFIAEFVINITQRYLHPLRSHFSYLLYHFPSYVLILHFYLNISDGHLQSTLNRANARGKGSTSSGQYVGVPTLTLTRESESCTK